MNILKAAKLGASAAIGVALAAALGWSAPAQAQQVDKVKMALNWNAPIADFIQYYVAEKNGYYKEAHLEVELMHLPGSVPASTSVGNGDAQIGQVSSDAVLVGIAGGLPLKAIFLLYQQTPTGVIALKDANIKTIADLKGKTVSTSVQSPEGITLTARLREAGLDPEKDVNILNVSPAAKLQMMLTGQAQASTGFNDFQFLQAQMAGKDVLFLPFSTEKEPLYGHALVANTTWLAQHQDVARRFIAATAHGIEWGRDNVDKATAMVLAWDPTLKIDREFTKKDWEIQIADLIPSPTTKIHGIGYMETAGWANLAQMLKTGGVVKGEIDPATVYTNDYLPKDAAKW